MNNIPPRSVLQVQCIALSTNASGKEAHHIGVYVHTCGFTRVYVYISLFLFIRFFLSLTFYFYFSFSLILFDFLALYMPPSRL